MRTVVKKIQVFMFWVLCEIGGKIDIYSCEVGRFGGLIEWWAAQRRDRP